MSRLGNIQQSYGKQVTIAVANTNGSTVLASEVLPKNALIIASPVVTDNQIVYDSGTYSMVMTDANGEAVRLTYTIKEGSGLYANSSNPDILKLGIDKRTLVTNENGQLTVNTTKIIDNSTLVFNAANRIEVNPINLTHAGLNTRGVFAIDGETIKTNTIGQIYVDAQNLDRANNNQAGVVTSDNKTIYIDSNGVLSVVTQNLNKATSSAAGVVKIDGKTIKSNDNTIYVDVDYLERSTNYIGGVSKIDNNTITATNGILSVDINKLSKSSKNTFGLSKIDNKGIIIKDGIASVNGFNYIVSSIKEDESNISKLDAEVNKLTELFLNGLTTGNGGIYSLTCSDTTITNLTKPVYLEEPKNMKTQHVYVALNVITDCDFEISLTFDNNETPAIELTQINYNDEFSYQGFDGLLKTYPSTEMKQKRVILLFDCKNFKATRSKRYEKTTKITINIASVKNKDLCKKILYSIVRYNSNIYISEELDEVQEDVKKIFTFIPIEKESYWKEWDNKIAKNNYYRKYVNTVNEVSASTKLQKTHNKRKKIA